MNHPLILQHTAEFISTYDFSAPLHLSLAEYYRQKRHLGVKDRRIIGDHIYYIIRHFRLLSHILKLDENLGIFTKNQETATLFALLAYRLMNGDRVNLTFKQKDLLYELWPIVQAIEIPAHERSEIRYSIPDWLWEKFSAQWGKDVAEKIVESLAKPADIHLRQQRDHLEAEQWPQKYGLSVGKLVPGAWRAPSFAPVRQWEIYQDGIVEIQDEGSQLIAFAAGPKPGELVIDLCAGAGGKTMHLAALMNNKENIIATDKIKKRMKDLKKRLKRANFGNVTILDYQYVLDQYRSEANLVLIDVPCSGTGVFRRNPDDKFRLKPDQLSYFKKNQKFILRDAARLVRPGGRIVYSSCSLLYEENEGQLIKFLNEHQQFEILDELQALREFRIDLQKGKGPGYTLLPHLYDTDGFYFAVLKRKG
ncbi:MAG TPA: RsmB/NOP family class I SAM-dependent RNA methyltransferase [Candidatus Marinimicrobia bacterium]|nr:RsmB/NOP family class I SAM-dependent RNA methyltransferase [Candidatus Neomarinimicrobiota bacterium]